MSIFKECDIRGIYPQELAEADIYSIGRAIASSVPKKEVVVCGDARSSTPSLKKALIRGLLDSGSTIIDIGMEPTPVFYFAKKSLKIYSGVMITASHNPWQYNGLKIALGEMPITEKDISEIERRVQKNEFISGIGTHCKTNIEKEYSAKMISLAGRGNGRVVIDAGGGVTAKLAPQIFRACGYDVVELFCEYDGLFGCRNPNPAVYEELKALQQEVLTNKADFGVAFDGDGDRVVFVDEAGQIIQSERSFCLFLAEYLKKPGMSVVFDQKSSSIVKNTIDKFGGSPTMERSGHTFIKRTFLNKKSVLAGEVSGHYFFGELGYDDGIYAALRMGRILTESSKGLHEMVEEFKPKAITPDIRFSWAYSKRDKLLLQVKDAFREKYMLSELDGIRVEFPKGWLLLRKSVTEEGMTLRIEAENEKDISNIKNELTEAIEELRGVLL
jgi:phosphomannomutase/phosphoglucomutase